MRVKTLQFFVRYGLFVAFLVMVLFFSITQERFMTAGNLRTILLLESVTMIAALPVAMLLLSGGVDFSIGSILGLCVVVGGRLMADFGIPPAAAILLILAFALCIGAINGYLAAYLQFSPIIVTIGMMFFLRGVGFLLNAGRIRGGFGDAFAIIGRGRFNLLDIPVPVVIAAVFSLICYQMWYRTQWGRHGHAGGINLEAAFAAGINVKRYQMSLYMLTALAAGVGAIIQLSRLNSAPPVTGQDFELVVLTAVLLGGIAFSGGGGQLSGVIIGVLFIGTLGNGLVQSGVDPNWVRVTNGLVLIASAGVQVLFEKYGQLQASLMPEGGTT